MPNHENYTLSKSDRKGLARAPMSDAEYEKMVLQIDMRNSLAHELGHYFVAHHYGGEASIQLWRSGENIDGENKTYFANCVFTSNNPFHRSCIGWAGEIGKRIYQKKPEDPEELLLEIYDCWESFPEDFSNSDRVYIGVYGQPKRSLRRAIELLLDRRDILRLKVDELSEKIVTEGLSELHYPESSAPVG